jgi:hypothetical protein
MPNIDLKLVRDGLLVLLLPFQAPYAAEAEAVQGLLEQARVLWDARVSDDWAQVYRLLPPEEQAGTGESEFVELRTQRGPFEYTKAHVERVAVAGDTGWVRVNYRARPKEYAALPAQDVTTWRVWRRLDGTWHPVPQEKVQDFPQLPPQERPAEEEARLAQRTHGFWRAKEGQHWNTLSQYMEPDVRQKLIKQGSVDREALYKYLSHHLEWVEVIGDQGRVKVQFRFILNDPTLRKLQPQQKTIIEQWVKVDDQWYRRI